MEHKPYRIQTMNHIAERGIDALVERGCMVGEESKIPTAFCCAAPICTTIPSGRGWWPSPAAAPAPTTFR